jgi:tetratricopeptide (TPR) repeat protein
MSGQAIDQFLRAGIEHHQAGRLPEAEANYRQVLSLHPKQADALNLLGVIAQQMGQSKRAVELIRQAIAIEPERAIYHNNLANALCDAGQIDEAIAASRRAISLAPNLAQAYNNLGNALCEKKSFDDAIDSLRNALRLLPNYGDACNNLGNALRGKRLMDEAVAAYRQAAQLNPNSAKIENNLGNALHEKGLFNEAIDAYHAAVRLNPQMAEAHYNLGNALGNRKSFKEAIAAFTQAIELKPGFAKAYCGLANALSNQGQMDEATAAARKALEIEPELIEAHLNLCVVMYNKGLVDEALAACERAVAIDRESANAHYNLSLPLLLKGDFDRGWKEYEWRFGWKEFASARRAFAQPRWTGEELEGRTILLHGEQGFGDTIQFVRYVPLVAERGGTVILECKKPLLRLFRSVPGVAKLICFGDPLPEFDVYCSLQSLPFVFATTIETIPAPTPYLRADEELHRKWAARLAGMNGIKVGIAWAGSSNHRNDRDRSVPFAYFGPLAKVAGVTFFALQKDDAGMQAKNPPAGMELIDHTADLVDFAATAALIQNLDLVITVDTSIAHLAGALGKPVWVLIPFAPDWRWLLRREDSPWYPTMRLFRQKRIREWSEVFDRVGKELAMYRQHT